MPTSVAPIAVPAVTWTLLNTGGAAAGAVSIYPLNASVWIAPTASASPPSGSPMNTVGAIYINPTPGAIINQTLAELWPGFTSPAHVYCYAESGARVSVSCA